LKQLLSISGIALDWKGLILLPCGIVRRKRNNVFSKTLTPVYTLLSYAAKGSVPMYIDNWRTQLRKGMFDIVILNFLAHDPCHGYEIVQQLKKAKGCTVSTKMGLLVS
jgi:hypothetical protein